MKAAADLVKGVAFGLEKRDAGIKSLTCGILEENQYNARCTKAPQIGFVTPGSKYWDELREKNQLDANEYLQFVESNSEQYKNGNKSYLMIMLNLEDDTYKDVKNVRDMDKQELIGNYRN